ncbi:MAG TPA: hypothetical protein VF889_06175, partial [Bacteroidota bacterium]
MRRRDFMVTMASAGVGMAAQRWLPLQGFLQLMLPGVEVARGAEPAKKGKYWVWMMVETETPDATWKERFAMMRRAGIDAILPEIYDSRLAYYRSAH